MGACERYEELISAFIDGALAEEDRSALSEHMSGCAACQAYFDDMIAIHEAMDTESVQAPEDFVDTVMAKVRETPQERPGRNVILLRSWRRWAAAAACCAIVALGIWNFHNLTGTPAPDQPGLPAGASRSIGEADDVFDEDSEEEWAQITDNYNSNVTVKTEEADDAAPDTPADTGGVTDTAAAPAQPPTQGGTVRNDAPDPDSLSKATAEAEPAPEPDMASDTSAGAAGGTKESPVGDGIMSLSLEGGMAIDGASDPDSPGEAVEAARPLTVDYDTAVELFGHELVPCAEENFEGYSLHRASGSEGRDVIYDAVDYLFSNGLIQIEDRSGGPDWFLEDTESVVYNGGTFFVKDAPREGYTSVQYYPGGESGLGYAACFASEMEQEEVFALILSLVIP